MSCPRCGNDFFGPTGRIPDADKHCILCGFVELVPLEVHQELSKKEFKTHNIRPKDPATRKPCPVINCQHTIPKNRNLVMCHTCYNRMRSWKRKLEKNPDLPAPIFTNADGKLEWRGPK